MKFNSFLAGAILTAGISVGTVYGGQVAILDSSINTRAFFAAHYRKDRPGVDAGVENRYLAAVHRPNAYSSR